MEWLLKEGFKVYPVDDLNYDLQNHNIVLSSETSQHNADQFVRFIQSYTYEDFQKLNASISGVHPLFAGITADCEIEFRLARIDPDGNCTEGITRTKSTHTYLMDDPYTVRPSWNTPSRKYLNIWQGTQISFGAGGYAYYPGTVPDDMEGIVLIAQQLGNTVTHEVGHWLNLAHLWGNSNDPQDPNNCFDDDDVIDTPNTIGRTGCRDTANSCGSIDNVQNYMEYNFCDLMFT